MFYERMKLAQQEIKATVTVNTSDLGSKKKDEEPPDKDTLARKKGGRENDHTQRSKVGAAHLACVAHLACATHKQHEN